MANPKTRVAFFRATGGTVLTCLKLAMSDKEKRFECHTLVRNKSKLLCQLAPYGDNPALQNIVEGDVLDAEILKTFLSRDMDVIIWGVSGFQVGVRLGEEQNWTPESAIMNDPYFCEESAKRLCEVLETAYSDGKARRPHLVAMGTIGIKPNCNRLGAHAIAKFKPNAWFKGLKDSSARLDRSNASSSGTEPSNPTDQGNASTCRPKPRSADDDKSAMERIFRSKRSLFHAPVLLRPAFLVDDPADPLEPIVGEEINYLLKLTASRETVGRWLYNYIGDPPPAFAQVVKTITISKGR